MLEVAYRHGCDYFYRVNDDTVLENPWAGKLVAALKRYCAVVAGVASCSPRSLGKPYGMVGPLANRGNLQILTHDFSHR
jgi:GT2 family glycosyltransferase